MLVPVTVRLADPTVTTGVEVVAAEAVCGAAASRPAPATDSAAMPVSSFRAGWSARGFLMFQAPPKASWAHPGL